MMGPKRRNSRAHEEPCAELAVVKHLRASSTSGGAQDRTAKPGGRAPERSNNHQPSPAGDQRQSSGHQAPKRSRGPTETKHRRGLAPLRTGASEGCSSRGPQSTGERQAWHQMPLVAGGAARLIAAKRRVPDLWVPERRSSRRPEWPKIGAAKDWSSRAPKRPKTGAAEI